MIQDALGSSCCLMLNPTSYNIATQDALGSSRCLRLNARGNNIATQDALGSSRVLRLEPRYCENKMLYRVVAV